jgi:steroid delta-isomerase-like uncharacterized protein
VRLLHLWLLALSNLEVTDGFRSRSLERIIGGDQGRTADKARERHMLTALDNATIARNYFDAFNARDIEKGLKLVTNDVKWMNIPFNLNFTGHSGYREFHNNWTTAMPDVKVEIVNVIGGEEWTVVEFISRGTHTGLLAGPMGPIPATQKKLDLKVCGLFRIHDGLITESRVYFDSATMMRQFGLLPQTGYGQPTPSAR